jgi:two-component system response regulator HydG
MKAAEGAAPAERAGGTSEPYAQAKKRVLDAFERDYLATQLARTGNNITQAARLAGMDRSYFKRTLRRHGLLARTPDDDDE